MLDERIGRFPLYKSGRISYREAGAGRALVLLHGIGASSAAWLFQLEALKGYRVIACDLPGYGESDFLSMEQPVAADYARALRGFIDSLLLKEVVLVGSSWGALPAGAYARLQSERVRSMLFISPAGGYGTLSAAERQALLAARLKALDELGPEGLAQQRSPTVLSLRASALALELVRWSQRRIHLDGYRQASYCLASGRLVEDARFFAKPVLVVRGSADPGPEAHYTAIARAFSKGEYRSLPGLGHAAQIEDPAQLNALIADFAA